MDNKIDLIKYLISYLFLIILFYGCEINVSVPPPDESPPKGYIFIDTYPEGMQIFLEGKDRRRLTPDSITWLETKEYEFTLKHQNFLDTTFKLLANEEIRESLFIDYRLNPKMLSVLEFDSYPQGATIYLNDSLMSFRTPYVLRNILPGSYNVKYALENYKTSELTVVLKSSETTKSFLPLLDLTLWVDYSPTNSDLRSSKLTCITKDKNNDVWIGSEDFGMFKYDGFSFKVYYRGNSPVLNNFVNDIDFTSTGLMLIATDGMAISVLPERVFAANENHEWQFWQFGDTLLPIPNNSVSSITVQENGKFWFGTSNGLLSVFPEGGFYIKKVYKTDNSGLPGNNITDIKWNDGELWIGTRNSGAALFRDKNWEIFSVINSEMRSNNVNTLFPLNSRNCLIGISTNSSFTPGLAHFNNGSWFTEYFDIPDNNVLSLYQDSKGRTWVGTETSIIVFTNWENKIIYTYENTSLPIIKISGFLEDSNGDILITSQGGGLFRYLN